MVGAGFEEWGVSSSGAPPPITQGGLAWTRCWRAAVDRVFWPHTENRALNVEGWEGFVA